MRLYLLRHGKADKDSPTGRDEDRRLVAQGRAEAGFIADAFLSGRAPVEIRPQRVIASGAARASATADIVAATLGLSVEHEAALFPDHHLRGAMRMVTELVRTHAVAAALLVGHNPQLEDMLIALVGKSAPQRLRTGELAALDVELPDSRPAGRLLGLVRLDGDD